MRTLIAMAAMEYIVNHHQKVIPNSVLMMMALFVFLALAQDAYWFIKK